MLVIQALYIRTQRKVFIPKTFKARQTKNCLPKAESTCDHSGTLQVISIMTHEYSYLPTHYIGVSVPAQKSVILTACDKQVRVTATPRHRENTSLMPLQHLQK